MHDVCKVGELEIVQNRNETDVHKPRKIGEQSAEAGFSSHLFFYYHFFYLVFLLLSFFFFPIKLRLGCDMSSCWPASIDLPPCVSSGAEHHANPK